METPIIFQKNTFSKSIKDNWETNEIKKISFEIMQFAGSFGFAEIFRSLRALNNPEKVIYVKIKVYL